MEFLQTYHVGPMLLIELCTAFQEVML